MKYNKRGWQKLQEDKISHGFREAQLLSPGGLADHQGRHLLQGHMGHIFADTASDIRIQTHILFLQKPLEPQIFEPMEHTCFSLIDIPTYFVENIDEAGSRHSESPPLAG
jgi:hypothetical protein